MAAAKKRTINNIVGHTGSRAPRQEYMDHAVRVGKGLGEAGFKKFIYGDGRSGTMGAFAQAAIDSGMEVQGITLDFFLAAQGHALKGANPTISVHTMSERKAAMRNQGDAVIPLAGGFGTLEEVFEWWGSTNGKIKPSVLSPLNGYYDGLIQFVEDAVAHGHVLPSIKDRFHVANDAGETVELMTKLSFQERLKDHGAPLVANINPATHFKVSDTSIVIDHASFDVMEETFATLVGYDICDVPGQTIWEPHPYLRKIIFDNSTGVFNGLEKQVNTIFNEGFTPSDRRSLIAFAGAKSELHDLVEDAHMNPITPDVIKITHAEAKKPANDHPSPGI